MRNNATKPSLIVRGKMARKPRPVGHLAKFQLGAIGISPGAMPLLTEGEGTLNLDAMTMLTRHQMGDWGHGDKGTNDRALATGQSVKSRFVVGEKVVWLMTDGARKNTFFLMPDEV